MVRVGWFGMLVLFAAGAVYADTVTCHDGRVFDGEVLEENAQSVRIRTPQGTVTLPRHEVKSVEYKESPLKVFRTRRGKLAADDAKGHWELAAYCLTSDLKTEAEKLLTELRAMASPFYMQATRKLADLYAPKYPKLAVELYDELVAKTDDLEAKVKSRELKRELDRKRQEAYTQALKSLDEKQFATAIETLSYAYSQAYQGPPAEGAAAAVSPDEILAKLASIRKDLEAQARSRAKEKPGAGAGFTACKACDQHSGWGTCVNCKGRGTVEQIIPARITMTGVIPERKIQVTCPTCGGGKKSRCPECVGTGVEQKQIDARQRWTVKSISDNAWTRKNDDPLRAMKDAAGQALAKNLRMPEGFAANYPTTAKLRALIPSVPPPDDFAASPEYKAFLEGWRKLPQQDRGNFLCQYAFEVSMSALAEAVAQPAGEEAQEEGNADLAELRRTAPVASATLLSALPDEWAGRWVWVEAVYAAPDADWSGDQKTSFQLTTPQAHNLHPFVYLPEAKKAHTAGAADAAANPHVKLLASLYGYESLSKQIAELKKDDQVRLFGRVLYRTSRDPETSLEVWGVDVLASPETQKLLALVRKPVTFNFEETGLSEAVEMLALLTNTRIRIDVPKGGAEVVLNARATKQPLALALQEMLKEAKLAWVFEDAGSGLVVVQEPKPEATRRVESVLSYLK